MSSIRMIRIGKIVSCVCTCVFLTYIIPRPDTIRRKIAASQPEAYVNPSSHRPINQSREIRVLHDITNSSIIDNDIDNLKAVGLPVTHVLITLYYRSLQAAIPFLKDFKNPCWYESVPPNYDYTKNKLLKRYWTWDNLKADRDGVRSLSHILRQRAVSGKSWRLRCLPYFYIAGFSKCGSSDLFMSLYKNPRIANPFSKEFPYWNWSRWSVPSLPGKKINFNAAKWKQTLPFRHYVDMFDVAAENIRNQTEWVGNETLHTMITGDGTPSYAWSFASFRGLKPNNLSRKKGRDLEPSYVIADIIKMLTPQAKIIFALRDPVERLYSDYFYFHPKQNKSVQGFAKQVNNSVKWFTNCFTKRSPRACVYNVRTVNVEGHIRAWCGLYAVYLKDWLKVFSKDQVHILFLEDYRERKIGVLQEVSDFLGTGVPDAHVFKEESGTANARSGDHINVGDMTAATREVLQNFYRPWNAKLKAILKENGFPLPNWISH